MTKTTTALLIAANAMLATEIVLLAPHVTAISDQGHAYQVEWGSRVASVIIDGNNSFIADCTIDDLINQPEVCHSTRTIALEGLSEHKTIVTHWVPMLYGNGVQ